MLNILNKVSDWLNKICQTLAVASISILVIIMTVQIITRFFLGYAITWVDGTARYMLIWSTFLGATIAAKESGHITLTFLLDRLNGKGRIIGDCFVTVLFMILAGVVVKAGIITLELVIPQKSDSLPISVAWIYIAIPLCQAVIFYHLLINLLNNIKRLFAKEPLTADKKGGLI